MGGTLYCTLAAQCDAHGRHNEPPIMPINRHFDVPFYQACLTQRGKLPHPRGRMCFIAVRKNNICILLITYAIKL